MNLCTQGSGDPSRGADGVAERRVAGDIDALPTSRRFMGTKHSVSNGKTTPHLASSRNLRYLLHVGQPRPQLNANAQSNT